MGPTTENTTGSFSPGDFFDLAHGTNSIFFLLSSSSSYVLSGAVMSNFETFRNNRNFDINQIEYFVQKLNNYRLENALAKERLDVLAFAINLNTLNCTGLNIGNNQIMDNKNILLPRNKDFSNLKDAYFNFYLDRGDRLLIVSQGLLLNIPKKSVSRFQQGLKNMKDPKEYLNEIYIDLKSRFSENFLDYDASFIYLGVKENVFIEVSND
jgi:hypothetical protein